MSDFTPNDLIKRIVKYGNEDGGLFSLRPDKVRRFIVDHTEWVLSSGSITNVICSRDGKILIFIHNGKRVAMSIEYFGGKQRLNYYKEKYDTFC